MTTKPKPKTKPKKKPSVKPQPATKSVSSTHSAEYLAKSIRDLENNWRELASDAIQSLMDLASACGTTPVIDVRDKGTKTYWALRRRFDNLTGQLELFKS